MPRESYNVRVLRAKSLASLRTGVTAFNGLDNDGRATTVLLSIQHSFEMLLKAILEAKKKAVFDKRSQKSISLESAIRLCQQDPEVKLTDEEAGTIRVLDALRNAEQHWHVLVDEGLLYLNVRAGVLCSMTCWIASSGSVWRITFPLVCYPLAPSHRRASTC